MINSLDRYRGINDIFGRSQWNSSIVFIIRTPDFHLDRSNFRSCTYKHEHFDVKEQSDAREQH